MQRNAHRDSFQCKNGLFGNLLNMHGRAFCLRGKHTIHGVLLRVPVGPHMQQPV